MTYFPIKLILALLIVLGFVLVWFFTPTVSVNDIEITQSIQDMGHSVPLIAGKPTVVRAYFKLNHASTMTIQPRLSITFPDGSTVVQDSICADRATTPCPVTITAGDTLRSQRDSVEKSANFFISPDLITPSPGELTVRIADVKNAEDHEEIACTNCGSSQSVRSRPIIPSPTFRVRLLGVQHKPPSRSTADPAVPLGDFQHIKSWLRRAYPVGSPRLTVDIHPLNNVINNFPTDAAYNNRTCQHTVQKAYDVRTSDVGSPIFFSELQYTHYVGLVYDGGTSPPTHFLDGCASGIITSPSGYFQGVAAPATGPRGLDKVPWLDVMGVQWELEGSYGDWYTGHD
jgi:hypothetical protein